MRYGYNWAQKAPTSMAGYYLAHVLRQGDASIDVIKNESTGARAPTWRRTFTEADAHRGSSTKHASRRGSQ
jgi:hypothetical protein